MLYRWGNPQTYGAGTADDEQLFGPHDAEWIETGVPGAGHILIFNNGSGRPEGNYSSVDEIAPPLAADGGYTLIPGSPYSPDAPVWSYTAQPPTDFYAQNISGAQRLPNGNTLICNGPDGHFFEVTNSRKTIWEYSATGPVFRVKRYAPDYPGFDGTPWMNTKQGLSLTPLSIPLRRFSMTILPRYRPLHGESPMDKSADGVAKVIYTAKDGRLQKTFDALDWLALLVTHIPGRYEQTARYYGRYSNKVRGLIKKNGSDDELPTIIPGEMSSKEFRRNWARLIK